MLRKTKIVEALGGIGGPESGALWEATRDEPFYEVRKAAASALRR